MVLVCLFLGYMLVVGDALGATTGYRVFRNLKSEKSVKAVSASGGAKPNTVHASPDLDSKATKKKNTASPTEPVAISSSVEETSEVKSPKNKKFPKKALSTEAPTDMPAKAAAVLANVDLDSLTWRERYPKKFRKKFRKKGKKKALENQSASSNVSLAGSNGNPTAMQTTASINTAISINTATLSGRQPDPILSDSGSNLPLMTNNGLSASPSPEPTRLPSAVPTQNPSVPPTNSPTNPPTRSPTFIPTSSPTFIPTSLPTFSPTNAPMLSPTSPPSRSPTAEASTPWTPSMPWAPAPWTPASPWNPADLTENDPEEQDKTPNVFDLKTEKN